MSRIWLPLLILVGLVVGLTLFLTSGDSQRPYPEVTPGSPAVSPEKAPDAAPALESKVESSPSAVVERTTLDLPDFSPQPKYAEAVAEGEGYLVSVIDGNSEEPLPFAEVMVLDTGVADMQKVEVEMSMKPDFENLFVSFGVTYRTDAQGQVRIPEAVDDIIIAGRTPEHFNFDFEVDLEEDEILLRLSPVEFLVVKVIDRENRSVEGAPITLRIRDDYYTQDLMKVFSGEDGLAKLKIFDLLKMQLGQENIYAALQVLTPTPIEAKVSLQEIPETPPVLVIPPTGSVDVVVLDGLGKPSQEPFFVRLDIITPDEMGSGAAVMNNWEEPHENLVIPTRNGVASFPLVDFGLYLRATAFSSDGEQTALSEGEGPTPGGGKVVFQVTPEVQRPILVGRILNEEGDLGKNLNLESSLKVVSGGGNSSTRNNQIRTNEDGGFRIVMDDDYKAGDVVTLTITMRKTKRKPKRSVRVQMEQRIPPGEHDLGDLVVTELPTLAAGIVLDSAGEPLDGAELMVEMERRYGEGPTDVYWESLWENRVDSGDDGHFLIQGEVDGGRLRVKATHSKHLETVQEIQAGATGLNLRMQAGLVLKGRFLLDEDIDARHLQLTVDRPETDDIHIWRSPNALKKSGAFRVESQEAGPALLVLKAENPGSTIYSKEIFLQVNQDGELDLGEIDLRGRLTHFSLSVVDSSGNPIEQVGLQTAGQDWPNQTQGQPVDVLMSGELESLTISADGYRSVTLDHSTQDQEVVLLNGFSLRLILDNPLVVPEGYYLEAMLTRVKEASEEETDHSDYHHMGILVSCVVEKTLPSSGDFRVQCTLHKEPEEVLVIDDLGSSFDPFGPSTAPVLVGKEQDHPVIRILEVPGTQEFHFSLSAAAVDDAIAMQKKIMEKNQER